MAMILKQLLEKKVELERQIEETTTASKAEALAKIREIMEASGLTAADLGGSVSPRKRSAGGDQSRKSDQPRRGPLAGQKVAPKYRDPESGTTWTGRGLQPRWLEAALADGKKIEDFAVS